MSRDPDTNCSVGRSFMEGIASKEDEKKRRKAVPIATQATVAQKRNGSHALHAACVRAHGWHVAGAGEVAQEYGN